MAKLGRAQEQAGDRAAAKVTLQRAIDVALSTGDLRTASLARVRLARVMRGSDATAAARPLAELARQWYLAAGGGDAQRLAEYLLAALALDENAPEARPRLAATLLDAEQAGDVEAEVLALDALARLDAEAGSLAQASDSLERADRVARSAAHLVTEADRFDAERARVAIGRPGS